MAIQLYVDNELLAYRIENLRFSNAEPGGFLTCDFDISVSDIQQALKELGFDLLSEVIIRDGFQKVWEGFIADTPRESEERKIHVSCLGYWAHARDNPVRRIFCDTAYSEWEDREGTNNFLLNKENHLRIGCRSGQSYALNDVAGFRYLMIDGEDTIKRIKFSYSTNYDNAKFYAQMHATDDPETLGDLLWEKNVYGVSSGSEDITLTAPRKYVYIRLKCFSANAYTGADNEWHVTLTNLRIYGVTYDITAGNVLKNTLSDCPKLSSDQANIASTTFTIEPLTYRDDAEVQRIWEDVNKYHAYRLGVWDDKKLHFSAWHTSIDYFSDTNFCKLSLSGESVEELYNKVKVKYTDETGKAKYTLREDTSSDNYLNQKNWNRKAVISCDTTDLTKANQVGDTFLNEHKTIKNTGTATVGGKSVRDEDGNPLNFYELRSGKNIRIRDMRGRLVDFRVVKVDVDYEKRTASLSLDRAQKTLDILLARMAIRDVWK